jgi:DNA-directed RNA polymerase specialized sigma24 family protein
MQAANPENPEGQAALEELLGQYYPALQAHLVLQCGCSEQDVQDVLHDFTVDKVLGSRLLEKADRGRGHFRTFMLAALDNFYSNRLRAQQAKKRAPSNGFVSLEELEGFDPPQPAVDFGAAFDQAWALRVMDITVERMQTECRSTERPDIYEVFEGRLLRPFLMGEPAVDYEFYLSKFPKRFETHPSNLLTTGKRMFARMLRSVIREYVRHEDQVDEEIEALIAILSASP